MEIFKREIEMERDDIPFVYFLIISKIFFNLSEENSKKTFERKRRERKWGRKKRKRSHFFFEMTFSRDYGHLI